METVRNALLALSLMAAAVPAAAEEVIQLPPIEVTAPYPLVPATYRETPLPAYPPAARQQGLEGVVLLAVRVRADGRVGEIRVRESSGARLLDESAVTAVKRWTFVPARQGPRAVDSWVEVPVKFALSHR